jgi:GT2 family glycosyltransferase
LKIEVSIITINYNGLKDTCALIETIPFNENMEVIVVDNASNNQEADTIAKRYPRVKVIQSERNLGFAGGNNLGIQAAQGKYLFLINNDTIIRDFKIQALIDRMESSCDIGVVCPKIRFSWGNNPIQFAGYSKLSRVSVRNHAIGFNEEDQGQYETAHPTPYAHGAAMLIRRDAIDKVGLMPECFFLYYEELDWSMMFTRAGYQIWYDPLCTIYHKESQSTGQNSPLRTYFLTRNRLLLVRRNPQEFNKMLAYIYLIGIVAPRDILKYTFIGRFDLLKSIFRALGHFFLYARPKAACYQRDARTINCKL